MGCLAAYGLRALLARCYRVGMVMIKSQGCFFAAAQVRQAAVVVGVWVLLGNGASWSAPGQPKPGVATPPSAALAPAQRVACPLQPAAAVAGKKDGRFALQADLSSMTAGNIASFIVLGKEAAAAGRLRDAEVAFLMSCRLADRLLGGDSVESANAKYQLGSLYARLALESGPGASTQRAELGSHAQRLYADSLRTYQARYGPAHEKTRFAAEGLAALQQLSISPAARSSPAPSSTTAALTGPSFDCAKARSRVEKLICSDAELARLDRELGRLYARAKAAAIDGAAFGRQTREEWHRREATCRDRECLLRWYAYRHEQLMRVLQGQEPAPATLPR